MIASSKVASQGYHSYSLINHAGRCSILPLAQSWPRYPKTYGGAHGDGMMGMGKAWVETLLELPCCEPALSRPTELGLVQH